MCHDCLAVFLRELKIALLTGLGNERETSQKPKEKPGMPSFLFVRPVWKSSFDKLRTNGIISMLP
jgi:hypothetical protein